LPPGATLFPYTTLFRSAEGVLDAAIAMGFFPPQVDRRSHVREIHLILAEMASRPLAQWSIAEAIWRVARIGQGAGFRLPAHLLRSEEHTSELQSRENLV